MPKHSIILGANNKEIYLQKVSKFDILKVHKKANPRDMCLI